MVQGQPIEFIIDTGSPVTMIPPIVNSLEMHKTTKCFVDVNKNPIRFKGEATVEVKTEECKKTLSILVTENENTQPLLGLDWLDTLEIGLQGNNKPNIIRHVENDERREKIVNEYENFFENNHTIKDLTIDINLKPESKPIQPKGRPVPIPFHSKNCQTRTRKIDKSWKPRESRQNTGKLLYLTCSHNKKEKQISEISTRFEKNK